MPRKPRNYHEIYLYWWSGDNHSVLAQNITALSLLACCVSGCLYKMSDPSLNEYLADPSLSGNLVDPTLDKYLADDSPRGYLVVMHLNQ